MDLARNKTASPVAELRQYTLKPGRRETLIDLFDREFIESQEAAGMTIIGQFRDLDRPDMFVWMRGFDDMAARKDALTAFYDGPVWAVHKDAANATMIDSDDVLLLRPAWPGAGFDLKGLCRPAPAEVENQSENNRLPGIVEIRIHHLRSGAEAGFANRFETDAVPLLAANGARLLGAFLSERAENTFPRLPVRSDENVLLVVTGFDDEAARTGHLTALAASPAWQVFLGKAEPDLARPTETLRLSPTSRSLLGLALQ
ncbi:NIPSNAP family protein [Mesorhizobium sp. 131-2-1]|uniref:NIPSNAP family protein n=1 Tax=Mesorhizobium sp. 131-2-1 TaxID=2744518 RepID=UPI00192634DF|nr:NIPSNAP family protein [Mesorhizobium sp. 131-2-1]BCG95331.1 NIPSNAP family containing protein [Mesorhizobium sp. 131-2-1]